LAAACAQASFISSSFPVVALAVQVSGTARSVSIAMQAVITPLSILLAAATRSVPAWTNALESASREDRLPAVPAANSSHPCCAALIALAALHPFESAIATSIVDSASPVTYRMPLRLFM
jgi:hypothetical protein